MKSESRSVRRFSGVFPAAAVGVIAVLGTLIVAGPLDPPVGPIAPTYKTLTEVEPRIAINATNTPGDANSVFRITQRGSYYLTGNLAGASGRHTIEIEADEVTIDLNGFSIVGVSGSFDGVNTPAARRGITIRNGTVRQQSSSGIFLGSTSAVVLEDLTLSNNGLDGVWPGTGATVTRVNAINNSRDGFNLSNTSESTLTDCVAKGDETGFKNPGGTVNYVHCIAQSNRLNGFELSVGGRVIDCVSAGNTGAGFVALGDRAILEGCNAENNTKEGFVLGSYDNTLTRCVARGNGRGVTKFSGFRTAGGGPANTLFTECVSIFNGKAGFELAGGRPSLTRCEALDNAAEGVLASSTTVNIRGSRFEGNEARGLDIGSGSVVEDSSIRNNSIDGVRVNGNGNAVIRKCQIVSNGAIGASVNNGSVIEDCLIATNVNQGLIAGTLSIVRRCTVDTNGTAAGNLHPNLSFTGAGNLVEDNYIFNGDSGIVVSTGGGTIVRRNICNATANNYGGIVPGNRVANINSSASLASTNSNDNFSY
jgi:parallel beta-helix repeat protein